MIKLSNVYNTMDDLLIQLNDKAERLEEQEARIEDAIADADRQPTKTEKEKLAKIENMISDIDNCCENLAQAMAYLRFYND